MVDLDWAVWPIFILQVFILIFMLLPQKTRFFGLTIRSIVIILLVVVCIGIAASLYHDSTDILKLYF